MTSTDKDLSLTPLKGNSGKAYMGTYPNGDRVFVKMNTTPILAALAKEQIAPQLLWAKRLGNGDMMSAQEWLDCLLYTSDAADDLRRADYGVCPGRIQIIDVWDCVGSLGAES